MLYRVKTVGVSFGSVDPFSLVAVEKYEEALLRSRREGVPVKALMLCSPHNPLGMTGFPSPICLGCSFLTCGCRPLLPS